VFNIYTPQEWAEIWTHQISMFQKQDRSNKVEICYLKPGSPGEFLSGIIIIDVDEFKIFSHYRYVLLGRRNRVGAVTDTQLLVYL
jgi:hypothetical protein